MIHPTAFIHPKAHVEGATIGARSKVWQFASVIRGTVLGIGCSVASGATLDGPVFGDRCIVSPGVDIGPGFLIGDDVFIGPCTVLANDMWPSVVKDGFDYEALRSGARVAIVVESDVTLCSHVLVLPGVRIGAGAVVAGHATVTRDVPPGMLWTRDGEVRPKPDDWAQRRMRFASPRRW